MDEVGLVDRLEAERELLRSERREDRLPVRLGAQGIAPERALDGAPAAIVSAGEELTDRLDRLVDLVVAVSERGEEALVLARRDVDPALEQVAEELARSAPCRAPENASPGPGP